MQFYLHLTRTMTLHSCLTCFLCDKTLLNHYYKLNVSFHIVSSFRTSVLDACSNGTPIMQRGHQCSWTLTPANRMQVSILQFDNCNRKYPGPCQGLNLPRPRSLRRMGEQIRCQHILVSRFNCTPHGDLVLLLPPPIIDTTSILNYGQYVTRALLYDRS